MEGRKVKNEREDERRKGGKEEGKIGAGADLGVPVFNWRGQRANIIILDPPGGSSKRVLGGSEGLWVIGNI